MASPAVSTALVAITTTLATFTSTAAAAAVAATAAAVSEPSSSLFATEQPSSSPPSSSSPDTKLDLLCDWTRTAVNCRDSHFIQYLLVASTVLHLSVGCFGIWLLSYRNRGFNHKIFTELFVYVGEGLKPKPMDCIVFFTTVASFVKVPVNLLLIFDAIPDRWSIRIAFEQLYWVFVSFAFASYFVGLLYAMPVTTREGIFAVYQPETAFGSKPLPPIHVLTPTTVQKNIILAIGAIYPTIFGAGMGIASGALRDNGHFRASRILMLCQYSNWVLILWSMAAMFFYYGLKYTFILRANIIIAEAALKAPRAAFGIGNLKSRSPARFLFIQLQITGFGGSAATVLAGSLCLFWVLFQRQILSMVDDRLPHTIAFFWTGAMAVAFFVFMALITAQSVRSRKRGMNELSTTSLSTSGGNGQSGRGEGQSSNAAGAFSTSDESTKKNTMNQSHSTKGAKQTVSRSDPEVCLTHGSSGDLSTLHSIGSSENDFMDKATDMYTYDLEAGDAGESESESYRAPSLTPPPRPVNGPSSSGYGNTLGVNDLSHSQLRESVFGGRTPREDKEAIRSMSVSSASPQSPTQTGFSLFPLSLRSSSRNSVTPRPSTSSATSGTGMAPSYHTTSISTVSTGVSNRLSKGSSTKNTSSYNGSHLSPTSYSINPNSPTSSTSPTSPISPTSSINYTSPTSLTSPNISLTHPPPAYRHHTMPQTLPQQQHGDRPETSHHNNRYQYQQRQLSQPLPQLGGPAHKQTSPHMPPMNTSMPLSVPVAASLPVASPSPSTGPGGGYRSHAIELETIQQQSYQQHQQLQQPFQPYQQQYQYRQQHQQNRQTQPQRSDSGVDPSWSLPPTSKKYNK